MRIDLETNSRRPLLIKLAFAFLRRHLGVVPGPMLVASFRPKFLPKATLDYQLRAMSGKEYWSATQAELLGAYVSELNSCHF